VAGEPAWFGLRAFTAAKVVAVCWCLVALRQKWRSVPELRAADWLAIVYRLEREFGVTLTATDFEGWPAAARVGLTAGQLWELVAAKARAVGRVVPAEGWDRVARALAEALSVRRRRIAPGSRLYADLGMIYGFDWCPQADRPRG
jgi:hypothetical protein